MAPETLLPYSDDFGCANEYVDALLEYSTVSTVFQTLCGGVHILDFFTQEPSLYHTVIPEEWRTWLVARDSMDLLNFLMRDDPSHTRDDDPPPSLVQYIKEIRKLSLRRTVSEQLSAAAMKLPRHVAVGMIPKKIHEVGNFASYVAGVADEVATQCGKQVTHFVDFGSGQNYLGRTLASPPYNKNIVAVESKELNINGAKSMDVLASVAKRETVMRNKKLYRKQQDSLKPVELLKAKEIRRLQKPPSNSEAPVDLRPTCDLATIYTPESGKGHIQYVEHRVTDGDLSNVINQIEATKANAEKPDGIGGSSDPCQDNDKVRLMAISIHSCGNLSHHGIRSLILNDEVHAIAIVGCCYNLLSERLGPPTTKHPLLRPNQRAINSPRLNRDSMARDPHGFPMSERVATYGGDGIRLNITARMMAVQAPHNWSAKESEAFFTRHFYRALLQKVFLDHGVVELTKTDGDGSDLACTEPVIIGSLRKACYVNFVAYVRGALAKISQDPVRGLPVCSALAHLSDAHLQAYYDAHAALQAELSVTWSLMAFSAAVVESLIVVDRWLFLRQHAPLVAHCWVEPVFDYTHSPRNLAVVAIKAATAA